MSSEPLDSAPRREPPPVRDSPRAREADEQEMIMHLERDQLVASTFEPVPPARLGTSAVLGLWVLRIFAVLVSAMVIYTFLARLG